MNYEEIFETIGISIPNIVLPKKGIDLSKFSVVAVDQYAENDKYWDDVGKIVAGNISSLNLVLPENFFLRGDKDYDKRINTAGRYLENKDLVSYGDCFIFVKRKLKGGTRFGLIAAFDLEQYDYEAGKSNLIKVTEKTDMNRVVPRVALREKIELELPHIFLLISDKQNKLMTYLESTSKNLDALYDFYLMKDGGNIKGYKIDKEDVYQRIADILYEIYEQNDKKFSFAIGDGNHSFAAAKMHYENLKKTLGDKAKDHPARYALAEIINLYDTSMEYEPIHRLLTNIEDKQKAISEISSILGAPCSSEEDLSKIDLQILQPALDTWLEKNKNVHIEYVHDKKSCAESGKDLHALALVFDKFDKDSLVKTVQENKVLVRKSFSMGRPFEKRYYLEARLIK
jgi:hypothetical protein